MQGCILSYKLAHRNWQVSKCVATSDGNIDIHPFLRSIQSNRTNRTFRNRTSHFAFCVKYRRELNFQLSMIIFMLYERLVHFVLRADEWARFHWLSRYCCPISELRKRLSIYLSIDDITSTIKYRLTYHIGGNFVFRQLGEISSWVGHAVVCGRTATWVFPSFH